MDDPNPYAAPLAPIVNDPGANWNPVGAWRDGDLLVIHRGATLPPYCVFTGAPDVVGMGFDFIGPGDRYMFQLVVIRYQASLVLPVKTEIYHSHFWKLAGSYLGGIGGIAVAIMALVQLNNVAIAAPCGLIAVALLILGCYCAATRYTLGLYDIDEHYLWLRGVSPSVLERLPFWPYAPH